MCQKPPGRVRAPAAEPYMKKPRATRRVRDSIPWGCGRPAVRGALPLSHPPLLVHIYIPHNRTPCGRGLCRRGLLDSRGSHPHLFGLLGLASLPSLSGFIIALTFGIVNSFFKKNYRYFAQNGNKKFVHFAEHFLLDIAIPPVL